MSDGAGNRVRFGGVAVEATSSFSTLPVSLWLLAWLQTGRLADGCHRALDAGWTHLDIHLDGHRDIGLGCLIRPYGVRRAMFVDVAPPTLPRSISRRPVPFIRPSIRSSIRSFLSLSRRFSSSAHMISDRIAPPSIPLFITITLTLTLNRPSSVRWLVSSILSVRPSLPPFRSSTASRPRMISFNLALLSVALAVTFAVAFAIAVTITIQQQQQ
jgi:hypothetical protein